MTLFILYENSTGYSIFEKMALDEVNAQLEQVQESIEDFATFKKICKFKVNLSL